MSGLCTLPKYRSGNNKYVNTADNGCINPANRNTGAYEKCTTRYPVPNCASIPPIAPPDPEKPVTVPISGPRNMSVGSVCRFDTHSAWPNVVKHVAAIANAFAHATGKRLRELPFVGRVVRKSE